MRWERTGRPVWLDGNGVPKRLSYPSLRADLSVDVIIVGGGMTGSLVALVFAEAGIRVAVLEASRIGLGSTVASTALLLREPDLGLGELGRRYGARKARRIWALCAKATTDFVSTLRRFQITCDLEERDSILYTLQPEMVDRLQGEHQRRRRSGLQAEWLPATTLRGSTGISGCGAIRSSGNAQFDPYRACIGFMQAAAHAGAAVFEASPVSGLHSMRDHVQAVTPHGRVTASCVVMATGYSTPAWQPPVGRFQLHRTYVLATPRLTRHQRLNVGLDEVMLWDTERPYHYARWTRDDRLLLGGGDTPWTPRRQSAAAAARATRQLYAYYQRLFPALTDIGIERVWAGVFATTPDGLPYIGRHSRYSRRLFALGYGGNGMTFGFLAAQMLLEQWQGIHSPDQALFAFGRFR